MTHARLFTSESVTEGHPDKLADQISDAILDEILSKDPLGRVACETVLSTGLAVVVGEITTDCYVDMAKVVRNTIKDAGYTRAQYGIDWETCGVLVSVDEQSPDIAQGVNIGGAGDQGMMFGFACDETPELMPAPIQYAHNITRRLAQARKDSTCKCLRPDGKSQVTVEYDGDKVKRVHTVVVSCQHSEDIDNQQIADEVREVIVEQVIPDHLVDKDTIFHINPTGRFVMGGPQADAGLTGRKIIVDTYGGYARHGGGAFSGKDPSKVDRSAAYAARWVAKNIVAAGLATTLRGPAGLRHRRGQAGLGADRHLRHRNRGGRAHPRAGRSPLRPVAVRDHEGPRPAPAHLPADRGLRPLRPQRPRPALGAHRQGRGAGRGRRCDAARNHAGAGGGHGWLIPPP